MDASDASPAAAVPIDFQAAGDSCFGWFHPARAPARGVGVVLCLPMGYEALCAYRTFTQLAQALADAGFDVVRFDYHGTGESAGGDADADRLPAWTDSIAAAIGEVKRRAQVTHIALFGLRLGATLAAQAALQRGGVDILVMWAPCVTGRAFTRELRAVAAQREIGSSGPGEGDIVAVGALYTAQTLAALQGLECVSADRAPAPRILVIGRDDIPIEGPLPATYRAMGADATYADWPGYAAMMVEPHKAVLDPAIIARIRDWLSAASPQSQRLDSSAGISTDPVHLRADGVRERALAFGPDQSLFGMLSEPLEGQPERMETAVLLINVAGNYRIGPNRIYVKLSRALAAAGYRALRFDLRGIGDSRTDAQFSSGSLYSRQSTAEVHAAIDELAALGCKRFYVLGICSGSYVAFQTAQLDQRINGQILMNSRLLEWQDGKGGGWQDSMQLAYKSTIYYKRALLRSDIYPRLLRGQIDVRGIANRLAILVGARLKRAFNRLLRRETLEDGVLPRMKQLSARGTDTLMIMSAQDDGLDYVEFHLGQRASRMRGDPNFRMVMIEESDHTFSSLENQRQVIETVRSHLDKRLEKAGSPCQSLPGRVVTT